MTIPISLSEDAVFGRVGPNAVLQLLAALRQFGLGGRVAPLLEASGAAEWEDGPPQAMVDERRVARLHQAVRSGFAPVLSRRLLEEAGVRTADYLLSARIPRLAQVVLRALPAWLSARLLVAAIGRHAWTFAGSGRFSARAGRVVTLRIEGNPFCVGERAMAPVCDWHRAVFQRLFAVLVSPDCQVIETECEATGGQACCFKIRRISHE